MKYLKFILLSSVILLFTMCEKTEPEVVYDFDLSSSYSNFDGKTFTLPPAGDSFEVDFLSNVEGGKDWELYAPESGEWFTAEREDGKIYVTINANESDSPRESVITVLYGDKSQRLWLSQNYIYTLFLPEEEVELGAVTANYEIEYQSNIPLNELTAVVDPEGEAWITDIEIIEGVVTYRINRNGSMVDSRETTITISGGEESVVYTIVQKPATGPSYIVPLDDIDWDVSYVWDVMEGTKKVGEICREYIYKQESPHLDPIVRDQFIVAYPMTQEGEVDYIRGFVLDNGGTVAWNPEANIPGNQMIEEYSAGLLGMAPEVIYLPDGMPFTEVELEPEELPDAVTASLTPQEYIDSKTGDPTFQYGVVKIAKQYWMRKNWASAFYADGTPIAHGGGNADWYGREEGACIITGTQMGQEVVGGTTTDVYHTNPEMIETREIYGLGYNFMAISQTIIPHGLEESIPNVEDRLSPDGWTIPSRADFEDLIGYLTQGSVDPAREPLYELHNADQIDVAVDLGRTLTFNPELIERRLINITGFDGHGLVVKQWNNGLHSYYPRYWSIDYAYHPDLGNTANTGGDITHSGHRGVAFQYLRFATSWPTSLVNLQVGSSAYVRMIREN